MRRCANVYYLFYKSGAKHWYMHLAFFQKMMLEFFRAIILDDALKRNGEKEGGGSSTSWNIAPKMLCLLLNVQL